MMYRTGYRLLFWGFLFIFVHFKIGGFDLLADLLGYIFIINGLRKLEVQHERYQRALSWSLVLVVFSVILPVLTIIANGAASASFVGSALLLLQTATAISQIVMIFYIFAALMSLAKERNLSNLYDSVRFRWKAYFTLSTAILFVMPFSVTKPNVVEIPLMVMTIANFIAALLIILVVHKAGKQLAEG